MKKELEHKLIKRFPVFFKGYYKPMDETAMCWGFSCGDGWNDIIWQLCLAIEDELNMSWYEIKKYMFLHYASKKWNNFIYWLFEKYVPKRIKDAANSSWLELSEDDRKNKKKVKKTIRHMKAGQKLRTKYWIKFINIPGICQWYPATGFEVSQVKEKFAVLCFYCPIGNDKIRKYIHFAEYLSSITCETCGRSGQLRGKGWLYTACQKCCKSPWDYTPEEMREFRENNAVEFLKFLEKHNLRKSEFEEKWKKFKEADY